MKILMFIMVYGMCISLLMLTGYMGTQVFGFWHLLRHDKTGVVINENLMYDDVCEKG
jgi:hypothetical protein